MKSFGKAISNKINDLIKRGKLKSFGEIWSEIGSREQDKDVFEWHELEKPEQTHIKGAEPGMIFKCIKLERTFIREKSGFIIVPKTYLGTGTIRGSAEFVEALVGEKFCLVTYSIIIKD